MKQSYASDTALVLTSGGQDSTTCLYWARANFAAVQAIGFFYNQKHANELGAAAAICARLGLPYKQVDIGFLSGLTVSNLFAGEGDISGGHVQNAAVPASFVPYRNLLFLTLAAAWAGTIGAKHVVIGVCETDYSGYADCRDVFIKSTQAALNLATDFKDRAVVIHTPLMWLTKAEEFRMAEELDCLDVILNETRTCYNGDETLNDFGRGCGTCPACLLRRRGFDSYRTSYQK